VGPPPPHHGQKTGFYLYIFSKPSEYEMKGFGAGYVIKKMGVLEELLPGICVVKLF
jgi:hypothetical protein